MLKAKGGHPVVLETGCFIGTTTAWLALTLDQMGGGTLIATDIDPSRCEITRKRIATLGISDNVCVVVTPFDVERVIGDLTRTVDVVWIDDDHSRLHVESEINALWPKMKPGGLMLFHDVSSDGVCQLGPLVRRYGGIALDLPRLGPDGGLGFLQVPL